MIYFLIIILAVNTLHMSFKDENMMILITKEICLSLQSSQSCTHCAFSFFFFFFFLNIRNSFLLVIHRNRIKLLRSFGDYQLMDIAKPQDPTSFDIEEFWGMMPSKKNKVRNILHTPQLDHLNVKGKPLSNKGPWLLVS